MATFSGMDVATISIQELHDMVATRDFTVSDDTGVEGEPGDARVATSFVLDPVELAALSKAEFYAVIEVLSKVNSINNMIADADSEFHDIFDGSYC